VNGLPGSGKTTLAVALAATLGAQLLSKDAVKEAIAANLETPPMAGLLGAIAMDTVWALASAIPATVVIESWWFRPRDLRHWVLGSPSHQRGATTARRWVSHGLSGTSTTA
jgi:AAA domain